MFFTIISTENPSIIKTEIEIEIYIVTKIFVTIFVLFSLNKEKIKKIHLCNISSTALINFHIIFFTDIGQSGRFFRTVFAKLFFSMRFVKDSPGSFKFSVALFTRL